MCLLIVAAVAVAEFTGAAVRSIEGSITVFAVRGLVPVSTHSWHFEDQSCKPVPSPSEVVSWATWCSDKRDQHKHDVRMVVPHEKQFSPRAFMCCCTHLVKQNP